MGGYSWYQNCRLNRISSWENNPSYDIPSEIIYIKEVETQKTWSLGLNPMPDKQNYNIIEPTKFYGVIRKKKNCNFFKKKKTKFFNENS